MTQSVPVDYRLWIPGTLESPFHYGLSFTPWASFFGVRSRLFTGISDGLQQLSQTMSATMEQSGELMDEVAAAGTRAGETKSALASADEGLSGLADVSSLGEEDDAESEEAGEDEDEDEELEDDDEDDDEVNEDGEEDEVGEGDEAALTVPEAAEVLTAQEEAPKPRPGRSRSARKPAGPAGLDMKAASPPEAQRLR